MSRAASVSTGFLAGICVFAWLTGPVLETRFGVESLLIMYGAVSMGVAATTYVLVRQIDTRFAKSSNSFSPQTSQIRTDQNPNDGSDDEKPETLTVSLGDLDDLDVEREVRRLKAEQTEGADED